MPWRDDPASPSGFTYVDEHGQDDLTADDRRVEQTRKVFPDDDALPQPSQWPAWEPETVVDEHGEPT